MFENEETAKCILLSGRSIMVKRRGVQHTMKVDVMELTTSRALVFAQRDNTAICTNCSRRPVNMIVRTKQHRREHCAMCSGRNDARRQRVI